MALPDVGDSGWGAALNEFLLVAHQADGNLTAADGFRPPGLIMPFPFAAANVHAAPSGPGGAMGVRIFVAESGTIESLGVYVASSAEGEIDLGIYSTGDPRVKLASTGAYETGAARELVDHEWHAVPLIVPLPVEVGDQADFVAGCTPDASLLCHMVLDATQAILPTGYLSASNWLMWDAPDAWPLPASITEAEMSADSRHMPLIVGKLA